MRLERGTPDRLVGLGPVSGPIAPLLGVGLNDVPEAGYEFRVLDSARAAADIAEREGFAALAAILRQP